MKITFIFGIRERSGTNFLNRLLLMHPNCQYAKTPPENYLLANSQYLVKYTDSTLSCWGKEWFGNQIQEKQQEKDKLLKAIGDGILSSMTSGETRNLTYITKTPSPQGLEHFFDLFPEQKLIILVRNGKDLVESAIRTFAESYSCAMAKYSKNGQAILDFQEKWQSKQAQILFVYYENLVRYTKLEVDRIFTFLDLDPNLVIQEQLESLAIYGSSTNKGKSNQVNWNPVYDKSNFKPLARSQNWSDELHQQYENRCGEVSSKLGYDLITNLPIQAPAYLTNNQSPIENKLAQKARTSKAFQYKVYTISRYSSAKIAQEILREFGRKIWFAMGENEVTQFIYRRLLESATSVKPDIIAPRMGYYSNTKNDRWIIEYIFPGKYDGYFVEAGAADGKTDSSCYLLETEYNWQGICIESHEHFFLELAKNRPRSICENICLAQKDAEVVYLQGDIKDSGAYLGGIKADLEQFNGEAEEFVARGESVIKQATTLEALLDKHRAPKIIDYAAFDIEGSELKVLEVFPFEKYIFLALTLKCDDKICWESITQRLKSKGYREVKNPFNQNKPWERYWLHSSFKNNF